MADISFLSDHLGAYLANDAVLFLIILAYTYFRETQVGGTLRRLRMDIENGADSAEVTVIRNLIDRSRPASVDGGKLKTEEVNQD